MLSHLSAALCDYHGVLSCDLPHSGRSIDASARVEALQRAYTLPSPFLQQFAPMIGLQGGGYRHSLSVMDSRCCA